jgi:phosphatidylglycerophosphatase A
MSEIPRPQFGRLLRRPDMLLAFGFGSGLSRWAPGTLGSLVGVICYIPLSHLPNMWYLIVVASAFALGVWICGSTATTLETHDHPGIVWDEFVGIWVTFIALPSHPLWLLAGFGLFRLFDILKPWPVGPIDRQLGGGFGIMADDLVAGLMALAVLQGAALGLSVV